MTLWELCGAVALLVLIVCGAAIATYYERDLLLSLRSEVRDRSGE